MHLQILLKQRPRIADTKLQPRVGPDRASAINALAPLSDPPRSQEQVGYHRDLNPGLLRHSLTTEQLRPEARQHLWVNVSTCAVLTHKQCQLLVLGRSVLHLQHQPTLRRALAYVYFEKCHKKQMVTTFSLNKLRSHILPASS